MWSYHTSLAYASGKTVVGLDVAARPEETSLWTEFNFAGRIASSSTLTRHATIESVDGRSDAHNKKAF